MSLADARDALRTAVLELLWAQWTDLGIAGTAGSGQAIVDPEALVVAALSFGRHDPRLFDEVLDWLSLNGDLLDVTRLRRLLKPADPDVRRLAAAIIDFLRQQASGSKWDPLSERWRVNEGRTTYAAVGLMLDSAGTALPTFGATDALFERHGFSRPPLELRGMSTRPPIGAPCNGRLAARALAGIGVRAETLLYLWTHETAHGRLVAARIGYSQRQVAEYLAGLAEAGFARRFEVGRTVQYRLAASSPWTNDSGARFVDWPRAYEALLVLQAGLEEAARLDIPYEASVVLRRVLNTFGSLLPIEGIDLPQPACDTHPGEAILGHASDIAGQVSDMLRSCAAPSAG